MERDRFGPVAIHSTPRNFRTSARKFWLNGLRPRIGPAKWKIPFHSTYENFGKSNRNFLSSGTRPRFSCYLHLYSLHLLVCNHIHFYALTFTCILIFAIRPCHRKCSQSERRKAVVCSSLLYLSVSTHAVIGKFCGPYFVRPTNYKNFFISAPD